MSCMKIFVHEAAMATMELKRAASPDVVIQWPVEQKPESRALRMSWVVVTDENGKRSLCARWNVVADHAA